MRLPAAMSMLLLFSLGAAPAYSHPPITDPRQIVVTLNDKGLWNGEINCFRLTALCWNSGDSLSIGC